MSGDDWRAEFRSLRQEMQEGFRETRAAARADQEELKAYIAEHVLKRLDSHSKRLDSLEGWRNWVMGAAAVVGMFVGQQLAALREWLAGGK